ncbi:sugar O-acetyltransferase [Motilimonas pumila]|uniref:Acetyltransferase n=1 Tax=Motilimonas pumila TaxID=2303987 RepID=A0A418YFU5_9GAMM|nr:sugar O-acetyltransferase [Motilimonas pumila]RJG48418.1 sugar O-acetyltransferase [Motilimonas pumila]
MTSEKAKMLAGKAYDAWDDTLVADRMRAKSVCHLFNQADPTQLHPRMALLTSLLNISGQAHIEPVFFCDYGYNIHIGDHFYANHHLTIIDVCEVNIGHHVLIGPHVMIATAGHPIEPMARRETEFGRPINIGNDVWIGGNVSILPGVSIGDNCVIGAGAVVVKDIPANSVAVGNPCKVVKQVPLVEA